MRTSVPPLLPILRSRVQGDFLALLYLHPDRSYSLTEIAAAVGSSPKVIHTEANRLVSSGFARDHRMGPVRLVEAPPSSPLIDALTQLLLLSYGPRVVLKELLEDLPGLEEAFIYGSWAARYEGVRGPLPGDVDVAVIGDLDLDRLDDIAIEAQRTLRRSVDIRRVPGRLWRDTMSTNPFVLSLRTRPRVPLIEAGDPS